MEPSLQTGFDLAFWDNLHFSKTGKGPGSISPAEVSGSYTEASALAPWSCQTPEREAGVVGGAERRALWLSRPGRSEATQGDRTFLLGLSPPALFQVQLADQPPALLQELIKDVGGVRAAWCRGPVG